MTALGWVLLAVPDVFLGFTSLLGFFCTSGWLKTGVLISRHEDYKSTLRGVKDTSALRTALRVRLPVDSASERHPHRGYTSMRRDCLTSNGSQPFVLSDHHHPMSNDVSSCHTLRPGSSGAFCLPMSDGLGLGIVAPQTPPG